MADDKDKENSISTLLGIQYHQQSPGKSKAAEKGGIINGAFGLVHGQEQEDVAVVKQPVTARRATRAKRRFRPGAKALMEIRKFQKTTKQLVPRAPFTRLCKEILCQVAPNRDNRIQSEAVSALKEASEAFLVTFFEAANRCAIHAGRVTITPADFALLRWILSAFGVNLP